MKNLYKIFIVLGIMLIAGACTERFNEINTKPDSFTQDEVSAKYFLTQPQFKLLAPDRYPYWRANLILTDRYAGHVCFGFKGCWWSDELGYSYSSGYTDAAWNWMAGYIGGLDNYMKMTDVGGEFENQYMYAIGQIIKGLYFQMYTDVFGMIPYSEATNPDITTPKFDSQAQIYQGIIAELDEAVATIGDATRTGAAVDDVGENDVYCGGDLQKWKKMANTLKLRLAMRAYGADGETFAEDAITQAMAADLLSTESDNVLMNKDFEISQWSAACYGDIWWNFGGTGSKWTMGKTLIDALRDNNDPRLPFYAEPAAGGTIKFTKPGGSEADNWQERIDFISGVLDDAGVAYSRTYTSADSTYTFDMPENMYYVGQPTRLNGKTRSVAAYDFFSLPAADVVAAKNSGNDIRAELVISTAEAYFLQAEAVVKDIVAGGAGVAQNHYQEGIRQAMALWGVSSGDADNFIANEDMALLNGTTEENLEKIATQRWIASFTDGFEGFAIVRDMGYPADLADGVSDIIIYGLGDINGKYPQRLRYGNSAANSNPNNYAAAVAAQGADVQDTKLWWAK
ncbi:MAG TPA: SusD/RagB family nutrient-binding outer membrane lipoprotein [Bacteroidales bacterium]|nr:SusD/RagB family nutrient-binding outer membrane lipoprotein [Bacteroidales bacterium]